ncbi:hypothetical protein [Streptomyces sp. ICBB 8177]|uniref:hypothetical protein n=1 Tax=Streptomyces sp. ICBB 8177 TaxID=563922 RepID=UPI000D683A50|nr:hypothetical protein [Streptomyces sp. ICBB 8177]PWI44215.1 hypothetical protein CK485_19615 [Streptomyces sp. ICBB 8177]
MTGKLDKAKGFKKSRPGTYLSIGTTLFGAVGVIKQFRSARGESDTLKVIDAVVRGAVIVTGVAVLVRELRNMNSDDVLAD